MKIDGRFEFIVGDEHTMFRGICHGVAQDDKVSEIPEDPHLLGEAMWTSLGG